MTYVTYERHSEGYGEITLQRPQKHNAINGEMIEEFESCLEQAKEDTISFLVITGAGDDTFCAGGDLHYFHGQLDNEHAFSHLYPMKEILHTILLFPVPTICLLNGNAFGGGCELATSCDIRIAKADTRFGFTQSTLGIVPGWGGGTLLYEKVHTSFAFQWITEGATYSVEKLYDKGWIHSIVTSEDFNDHSLILAPYIHKTIEQLEALKTQYKQQILALSLSARMNEEVRHCASLWNSPAHQHAVKQFLTK
ncbi:MAG TPA: enoyl-CoA hydratase/isomerase family protein [Bacillota bacterium]|nr:enoyl-CoA hydratase/isomerase family protein [Bacillota bacterium]